MYRTSFLHVLLPVSLSELSDQHDDTPYLLLKTEEAPQTRDSSLASDASNPAAPGSVGVKSEQRTAEAAGALKSSQEEGAEVQSAEPPEPAFTKEVSAAGGSGEGEEDSGDELFDPSEDPTYRQVKRMTSGVSALVCIQRVCYMIDFSVPSALCPLPSVLHLIPLHFSYTSAHNLVGPEDCRGQSESKGDKEIPEGQGKNRRRERKRRGSRRWRSDSESE